MCLLTTSTIHDLKRVFLETPDMIETVYLLNPDGLGVMYHHRGRIQVSRARPKSAQQARRFIERLPDTDAQIVCHWRMRTHGRIDDKNVHPYRVNADTFLAHNGVLHTGNADDPSMSDTWHFIRKYLAHLPTDVLHDEAFAEMLGDFIGSNRFAIMSADGRLTVINREQGVEVQGVWFSNTYAWDPNVLLPDHQSYWWVARDWETV